MYKIVKSINDTKPIYDAISFPAIGEKQVFSTIKNKKPSKHKSISLDK